MSDFESTRGDYSQEHFTIIEIDAPIVEGECTISGEPGYGTPLYCDQPSNATKTYKFTQTSAPLIPESGVMRLITSITETPAELKSGKGLASRGSLTVTMVDEVGQDPNPFAPAVTEQVRGQGGYVAKFVKRNILTNRVVRRKDYRVEKDKSIDLENGARVSYYVLKSVTSNKGKYTFRFEDELSRVNTDESVWPLPLEGSFRLFSDSIALGWGVDANVNYLVGDTVRSGEELFKIDSLSGIGTGSAQINTLQRGGDISYTNTLSHSVAANHQVGDEVFVCYVADNERIDDLLEKILLDIGFDAARIPKADWVAEIDLWHPNTRVNTIWIESLDAEEVIESILTYYMIDMWFDPYDREIKISAISQWDETTATLNEGNEIIEDTVTRRSNEELRVTKAYVTYNKPFLANDDSASEYVKGSVYERTELAGDDFFGEEKIKKIGQFFFGDKDSSDLLVNRYVNRYIDPYDFMWKTDENKLSFKTGDIVNTRTFDDVGPNGLIAEGTRAQITSIKTNYTSYGRDYTVKALSYEPVFGGGIDNPEVVIRGSVFDANLYIQYAGAPPEPLEITFVFDGTLTGSSSSATTSIKVGGFPAGSKVIIILANGADLQAKGGDAGKGGDLWIKPSDDNIFIAGPPGNGLNGATVLDCQGVDVDVYFSGPTPSANYPTADGYIRAPSGGQGGYSADVLDKTSGNGANGGDGRFIGELSERGEATGGAIPGENGIDGTENGSRSGWGNDGADNDAIGGLKGKGIVDNGGTVTLFGATASRYINGGGDHV